MNNDINKIADQTEPNRTFYWKPLQTFLPKTSPRGQPIEARSIKTCTSRISEKVPFRY